MIDFIGLPMTFRINRLSLLTVPGDEWGSDEISIEITCGLDLKPLSIDERNSYLEQLSLRDPRYLIFQRQWESKVFENYVRDTIAPGCVIGDDIRIQMVEL